MSQPPSRQNVFGGGAQNLHQQAAFAAQMMSATLQNPYAAQSYSSHYAQAYTQPAAGPSRTPDGYTISSTYVAPRPQRGHTRGRGGGHGHRGIADRVPTTHMNTRPQAAHWFEPGNHTCSQPDCPFTGSQKSVETHMMDRHLIYPPGWEKRKRKGDWDADLSLKG